MQEENNPWSIKSSKKIYNNPWIELTEHEVLNPAGNPGIYGVVHFHNLAVGVVPYQEGMIWLVGQYRFPHDCYSWEIPEGGGPLTESPLEAAKRELKEETGLEALHYQPLLEMDLSNSVSDEKGIVYLATDLTEGEAAPEECEELKIKQVTLEQAFELVEQKVIRDSLTVAAIYKMMILKLQGKLPAR